MNNKKKLIIMIIVPVFCIILLGILYGAYKQKAGIEQKPGLEQQNSKYNPMAPAFSLKDMNDHEIKLSDMKGKMVILNFWASWCKFCVQEMPDLQEFYDSNVKASGNLKLYAVNVKESDNIINNYLKSKNISIPVLKDVDGTISDKYGVSGLPTTFFINKDGTVHGYIPGLTNKDTIKKVIDEMKSLKVNK